MIDLTAELAKTSSYLKTVQVVTDPFEHFLLREPFSTKLYQTLLNSLPRDDAYDWGKARVAGERERGYFYLNRRFLARLPAEQKHIWEQVQRWTLSPGFYRVIMQKYQDAIEARLRAEERGALLVGEIKLIRDKTGYVLQPHTDRPNRVTTIMFYLPRDYDVEECGTAIYRPKKAGLKCRGFHRHAFDDFELVSKAPFVPNSGLCFLKSDRSFHGVEAFEHSEAKRDFLTFSIRCIKESVRKRARRHLSAWLGNQSSFLLDRLPL